MKIKEIVKQYGVPQRTFETWLATTGHSFKMGSFGGLELDDSQDVASIVNEFKEHQGMKIEAENLKIQARLEAEGEQAQAMSSMLITSGFNFDGYSITRYSGYISGDDAVSMDRPSQGFWGGVNGNVGADLLASLSRIRRNALMELKASAYALGCNAVIGVDFDYLTLDPETATSQGGTLYLPFLFAVTANGNAVVIEKNGTGI
jgi:uncharacterized protein YbjQ (UPF0145 family)